MKLLRQSIDLATGSGSATLVPQEPEDMWHIYNLLRAHDTLRGLATRKVAIPTGGADAKETQKRVTTTLTITVLRIDFDPGASELHALGRVCEENEYVSMGAHHTLDLELQRQFTISKKGLGDAGGAKKKDREEYSAWDSVAVQQLREATDVKNRAQVWAVVMQEGLANVCLVTEHQTLLRQRVEMAVPKKRAGVGAVGHEKGMERFYEQVLATLLRQMDLAELASDPSAKMPPLLLASPGFTATAFQKHLQTAAASGRDKNLQAYVKSGAVLVAHSSSGHVHALTEVLKAPEVLKRLADTKFARESSVMETFLELMREDEGRAWYGPNEVIKAVDGGAVGRGGGVLLISDRLFRSQSVQERRKWVALVDRVRKVEGGEIRVMSSAHESGKRLEGLGGIAAILTFPLTDLDDGDEAQDDGHDVWGDGEFFIEQPENRIHEEVDFL